MVTACVAAAACFLFAGLLLITTKGAAEADTIVGFVLIAAAIAAALLGVW